MPKGTDTRVGGDPTTQDITTHLAAEASASLLGAGRAFAARMRDAMVIGTGAVRVTTEGVEHIPVEELHPDMICPNCEGDTERPGENCGMCANWLAGREP